MSVNYSYLTNTYSKMRKEEPRSRAQYFTINWENTLPVNFMKSNDSLFKHLLSSSFISQHFDSNTSALKSAVDIDAKNEISFYGPLPVLLTPVHE